MCWKANAHAECWWGVLRHKRLVFSWRMSEGSKWINITLRLHTAEKICRNHSAWVAVNGSSPTLNRLSVFQPRRGRFNASAAPFMSWKRGRLERQIRDFKVVCWVLHKPVWQSYISSLNLTQRYLCVFECLNKKLLWEAFITRQCTDAWWETRPMHGEHFIMFLVFTLQLQICVSCCKRNIKMIRALRRVD